MEGGEDYRDFRVWLGRNGSRGAEPWTSATCVFSSNRPPAAGHDLFHHGTEKADIQAHVLERPGTVDSAI